MRNDFLDIKPRPGMTQRFVSEREMEAYIDEGWARRQASNEKDKKIRDSFNDEVADKMYLIEMPVDKYKDFSFKHMGGERTRLQESTIRHEQDEAKKLDRARQSRRGA